MTPLQELVPGEKGIGAWSLEQADKKAAHTVLWGLLAAAFPRHLLLLKISALLHELNNKTA